MPLLPPTDKLAPRAALACALLLAAAGGPAAAQRLTPAGHAARTSVDGADVCLFTSGTAPTMTLSAESPTDITWSFSADGAAHPTELRTTTGASADTMGVGAEGLYTVSTASGFEASLWWLSPKPSGAALSVDSMDCDAIYASASAVAPAVTFGGRELRQSVVFQWEAGDSILLTTAGPSAILEGLCGEVALTVRAVNQAFNEASATDTVASPGVRASFSHNVRRVEATNEASAEGDAVSAPAEVEFANTSRGDFTVSEWAVGSLARLYERDPVYQFQRPGTFRVSLTVTNEATGCASSDSSTTITVSDAALEFPNAFTPNGDGVNDIFCPSFRSLKSYELTIYNRWGRRVFTSSSPSDGWDGRENGREAAAGTYYFVARAQGYERGVELRRRGSITLVR